jgi:uncharacterized protein YjbI with pentapeptide repeats
MRGAASARSHHHPDRADLNGMILTAIDFARVTLRGASLHATNLMKAKLGGAILSVPASSTRSHPG